MTTATCPKLLHDSDLTVPTAPHRTLWSYYPLWIRNSACHGRHQTESGTDCLTQGRQAVTPPRTHNRPLLRGKMPSPVASSPHVGRSRLDAYSFGRQRFNALMHSTASYLRRLAGLLVVFAVSYACSLMLPPLAALPSMVIAYHEYWKAFRSRRTVQGAVRLLLCAVLLIAWDAAVAAVLCSVFGYSLRDGPVQRFCCLFHWIAVFLSIGWPAAHITGLRVPILQLLYDLPLFAAVLIAKLTGKRLNALYSKVDGNLLLGSLPFPEDVARLRREGVVAVVNMCREWPGPEREYAAAGITQLRLPTPDLSMPRLEDVATALDFISHHVERGKVFVHCRFGMGRSASIVLAFLARHRAMSAAQSIHFVRARRPEVLHSISKSPVVRSFED